MIGTQVANYRIEEKIGEGGMGVVYRAVDVHLDRPVAIKVLSSELVRNPELVERFKAEARAQANLNHTNLAILYAFVVEGGNAFMVIEYVEGETFEQMIARRGPIPSQDAIPLFKQALLGIGAAHRAGIIHRDIKPSNLMLNRQGIVKVMDFGIAKVLGTRGMTRTGTQMGTVAYMSPEQIQNRPVDIRSDIYALGVTLYEMLSGHLPFESESDFQIMRDHVSTPPPLPTQFYPYIPKDVEKVVLKSLEKDPNARFQSVEEFGSALEHPEQMAAYIPTRPTRIETVAAEAPAMLGGATRITTGALGTAGAEAGQLLPPPPPAPAGFWNQTTKLAAGGVGALVLAVGLWAAFRPHPVPPAPPPPAPSPATGPAADVPSGGDTHVIAANNADNSSANQNPGGSDGASTGKGAGKKTAEKQEPAKPKLAPAPVTVSIPAGATVTVRMIDSIDGAKASPGQEFAASVDAPVAVGDSVVIRRGADARVRLLDVKESGRFKGRGEMHVELVSLTIGGKAYRVQSRPYAQQGGSRGKKSAEIIGGAAAVGGAIGGLFHGRKGAAEGAGAGAGGGAAYQGLHGKDAVKIPSETRIDFTLSSPLAVTKNP